MEEVEGCRCSNIEMTLPLRYFSLQLEFADRAASLLNISLEQALMEYTSFWRRIHNPHLLKINNAEWSFDTQTSEWQELCSRIKLDEPADTVAYELYLKNNNDTETGKNYFGCFRYDFVSTVANNQGVIKIHFKNRDQSGSGPLSRERTTARFNDLKRMFEYISKNHPDATVVKGGSWLYNLDSYKRLFPQTFTSNMEIEEIPYPRTSGIWGQFLNSDGGVNEQVESCFIRKINAANNIDGLLQCFQFKILFATAAIESFYSHFEI